MNLSEQILNAGIIGCGGAGFPTDKKLKEGLDIFIVNGAECEPLLRTDRFLMREKAPALIRAVTAIKEAFSFPRAVISLKDHYHEEIAALQKAVDEACAPVELFLLDSFYPAGDEQAIVCEVTGKVVPPGGIPAAVGAVVDNVGTMYAVAEAMDGIPFTHKYLTVTGLVDSPCIVRVPIGTPLTDCVELAGGTTEEDFFVVTGGPMMGKPVTREEYLHASVTKTTSSVLILPAQGYHHKCQEMDIRHMLNQARSACIQCSFCTQMCPRYLMGHPLQPHLIMRHMARSGGFDEVEIDKVTRMALICCECGVCEIYACPMGLRPRTVNSILKKRMATEKIRWSNEPDQVFIPRPEREYRKIPSEKAAVRAGVGRFLSLEPRELREMTPETVSIPLKMHIGAPSVPCVSDGSTVTAGDCIARPPEGALGACVHASISGRVQLAGDRIIISSAG